MEEFCAPHVEKHLRMCKTKKRGVAVKKMANPPSMDFPYITPYDAHLGDPTYSIMGAEMAYIMKGCDRYEETAVMQRLIHTHPLPENIVQMQLVAMAKQMAICERSALNSATLYVCPACVVSGRSSLSDKKGGRRKGGKTTGECKMDMATNRLTCSSCQSSSVVSISTLGRIITLRQNRFYLAPCCGNVRQYTGDGDEFNEWVNGSGLGGAQCRHANTKPKSTKHRCELCSNTAEGVSRVDHLTGEFRTAWLCQRHMPHEDALRHVANWRQLEEEVRRRDRPLFRNQR